jgi:butyryl-CoA dehydrogenase
MVTAGLGRVKRVTGGSFIVEDLTPAEIFTPEDFSPEQRQIAELTSTFAEERVRPQIPAIEAKRFEVSRQLMREAGELGLLGIDVPEEYGGLEMDKVTSALVADRMSVCGSFNTTFGTDVTIGLLPLVWFGTPDQKARYLPKLMTAEWIAAYALSESSAGSDAMNIRTRAKLSDDGKHYILNGEKMWISNAGFADLFTVFAKIDGEKFTAFLIERGAEGFTVGSEEHKLGIRGSSTCPLVLSDCKVPVENLLGTAGKGHQIAFNILNVGRYKLGTRTIGGARAAFRDGVRYAKERIAFGKPITSFGLIQKKIAETAAAIYAGESVSYRVVGAIDAALTELDKKSPTYYQQVQKCIEEFAAECSILKFACSEIFCRAADEMLQLHGGYGYVEDYPAERSYRDARINKIFEGTNEINRIITTNWMMKRAQQGAFPLVTAVKKVMEEVASGESSELSFDGPLANEKALLGSAKKIFLFCSGTASQSFGETLTDHQEVMGALAEILAEVLILESTILRTEKMQGAKPLAIKLAKYYATWSFRVVQASAELVIGSSAEGEVLDDQMTIFRQLSRHNPINIVAVGREISSEMVEAGQYKL